MSIAWVFIPIRMCKVIRTILVIPGGNEPVCTAWLNGGLGVRIALVVGTITGLPLIGVHGLRAPRVGLYSVHVPVSRSWRIVASDHGQGVQGRSPCPLTQGSVHGRLIVAYINAANWVFATHCVWFPTPTTPPSQSHICLGYGICMSMCPGVSFSLVTHLMHRFPHRSHDPLWLSTPLTLQVAANLDTYALEDILGGYTCADYPLKQTLMALWI